MDELIKKIKHYKLEDIIKIEENDLQYKSLEKLYKNIKNKDIFCPLVVANSIICYQLSSSWEDYWEEFSLYFWNKDINIIKDLEIFIKNSKWNKRFVETKTKRIKKLKNFLDDFINNEKHYINNLELLQNTLSKTLNQKNNAKTIVFWVKMFVYASRIKYNKKIIFPFEIPIPIDSRLTKIYNLYNNNKKLDISSFYEKLSRELKIPPLHLDWLIWTNFNNLIEK